MRREEAFSYFFLTCFPSDSLERNKTNLVGRRKGREHEIFAATEREEERSQEMKEEILHGQRFFLPKALSPGKILLLQHFT